jgi:predicted Zn finger-like uncharacterized protein
MIASAMLVTTCPECETTFRISVGILEKAGGQVRCGRCAKIFDANVDLREIDESETLPDPVPKFPFSLQAESDAQDGDGADSIDEIDDSDGPEPSEVEVEVEAEAGAEAGRAGARAAEPDRQDETALPEWLRPIARHRKSWPWAVAAAVLTVTLAGQLMNRFRDELAAVPAVGPVLERVYAGAGIELVPPVDLDQFDLLDLTALAEPAGEQQGWLVIETRVRNKGPKVQPYPHIFVRLLDRWEDTVAGRYFAPNEYTVGAVSDYSRMNVGTSVDAQFIIMDPGPGATGFEVELCAEIAEGFICESDANFR